MWLNQAIEFPNLGIRVECVPDSFLLFGNVRLSIYGILVGIGIIVGFLVTQWQAVRTRQDKELYLDFALYALVSSLIGARLYYILFAWEEFREEPWQILQLQKGGLAIYGALIAAVVTGIIYSGIRRVSFWRMADTACVGMLAGQIIGRWGDFFNREAFGGYCNNLFAMRLSVQDVIPSSITEEMLYFAKQGGYQGFIQVHPAFLYESLWNLALLVFLLLHTRRKKMDGELFLLYLAGYGIGRFWIEGLRTDQLYFWGTKISVAQTFSLIFLLSAVFLLFYRYRKRTTVYP